MLLAPAIACSQTITPDGYGFKIFRVEDGLYPFVQVFVRTFDQEMAPLVNLNEMNVGVMVKGRSYAPGKRQYMVHTVRNREDAVRAVIVLDTSKTMAGAPFEAALEAGARFIDAKRPQDQVAVLALDDSDQGYNLVSDFERDPAALARRIADLEATGQRTRLYDGIGAALQMASTAGQGGASRQDADYIASDSVIVFSDGQDDGSALSRSDLMNRISGMNTPIPIYSLAYTQISPEHLKNLRALSKNSFGKYYSIGESLDQMTRSVEDIHHILQNDYVVTFRSYVPVDGEQHAMKIGVEYPSRSGRIRYQDARFEALSPPPLQAINNARRKLDNALKELDSQNPYVEQKDEFAPGEPATSADGG